MNEKHYPKISSLLSPELINISTEGDQYFVKSFEYPLNKPEPLPKLINRILAKCEFTDQVKRFFSLKHQNSYAPCEHTRREQENVEARIKIILKNMEIL